MASADGGWSVEQHSTQPATRAATPRQQGRRGSYMDAVIRRRLSMAVRALEFSKEQPSTDAGYNAVISRLEEDVGRANDLILQERDGRTSERIGRDRRVVLRRSMQMQLRHLSAVATAAAETRPDLAGKYKVSEHRSAHRVFVSTAKSLLLAAVVDKDVLLANGLGATFLEELSSAIEQFERATANSHTGRVGHISARSGLSDVVEDALTMVGILHGFNRMRFAAEPQLLAAWMSARNIAGPFRHSTQPPAEGRAA